MRVPTEEFFCYVALLLLKLVLVLVLTFLTFWSCFHHCHQPGVDLGFGLGQLDRAPK